jgi:hypothetical protein
MEYAQLNLAGTEAIQVTTHSPIEWDTNNYCSAEALIKDGKADRFRVVPLVIVDSPPFNPTTHTCHRDGCELINGQWQYKWTVVPLDAATLAANQVAETTRIATAEAQRIANLWQAAHDYEYAAVSGSAIGLLAIGVMTGQPKCLAVQGWIKSIWVEYYTRKATGATSYSFKELGPCPHTVPELMAELGL